MSELSSPPEGFYLPDDLCAHGCGREATIQHADLRFLCALCYSTEVTNGISALTAEGVCPTCGDGRDQSDYEAFGG